MTTPIPPQPTLLASGDEGHRSIDDMLFDTWSETLDAMDVTALGDIDRALRDDTDPAKSSGGGDVP